MTELAAAGAAPAAEGERLYTDVAGLGLVVLPLLFGLVLLGILLLFFLVEGWRRRALGRPLLAMAVALAGSARARLARPFHRRPAPRRRFLARLSARHHHRRLRLGARRLPDRPAARRPHRRADAAARRLLAALPAARRRRSASSRRARRSTSCCRRCSPRSAWPAGAGGPGPSRPARSPPRSLLYLTFGPALALFEELMSSGPLWAFAPLGAAIMLPGADRARAAARADAHDLRRRRRPRSRHHWAGSSPASPPPTAPTSSSSSPSNMSGTRRRSTARFAVNNDGAPVPYEAGWERIEMPYTMRRRWAAPAPAIPVDAAGRSKQVGQRAGRGGDARQAAAHGRTAPRASR